ncbi:preprotein translocase subunit SecE [Chloroflexota bacterium]
MTHQVSTKRGGFGLVRYFGEIISELKKVVWLSRREIVYLTVMVLVVSASFGIVLGLLDYGFTGLINIVFLGQ